MDLELTIEDLDDKSRNNESKKNKRKWKTLSMNGNLKDPSEGEKAAKQEKINKAKKIAL